MRIAHFIQRYPPSLGGSEAYFARLSRFLTDRGHEVVVFTTTGMDLASFWDPRASQLPPGVERVDGVEVRRFPLFHFPVAHRYLMKIASLVPSTAWKVWTVPFNPVAPGMLRQAWRAREAFDLVHASAFPYSFPLGCARMLAHKRRVPLVITPFVHTGDPDDPTDRIRRAYTTRPLLNLLRDSQGIFVQTEGERDCLQERGVSPSRIHLQGLGVDWSGCTGGDGTRFREKWQIPAGEVVVGHLANLSQEKGTVDLVDAAQMAWERASRFTLVLAGSEMANFTSHMDGLHPRGRLIRCGPISESEKRDFFASLDLFSLPSRSDSFGLVIPEAWANAVPTLAYRAGGIAWVIRDGIDGVLVPCGDRDALAHHLARLVSDAPARQRLGEAGHARMKEFEWEPRLQLVLDACEALVRERRGIAPPSGRP